ncbi:MAG: glycoside hydrolase family 3 protein [Anaerolineaceae bacterium]|nr:glycoside hydrolase family 3 protein [Anaerolineaceae bacterium]
MPVNIVAIPFSESNGVKFRDLNKNGKLDIYEDSRQPIDARVEDILSQMSLEEKAGMMMQPAPIIGNEGDIVEIPFLTDPELILNLEPTSYTLFKRHINHFFIIHIPPATFMAKWYNNIQKMAQQTRLGIPITISSDPRHSLYSDNPLSGVYEPQYSRWPDPLGFAAIADTNVAFGFGRIAREEYKAVGIRMALHPMADIGTQPNWSRLSGTFGENSKLAAQLVAAYIKGFQGDHGLEPNGVACMVKHFPGSGPAKDGLDPHFEYGKNLIYPGNNFNEHLVPFQAAVDAGVAQVMTCYGIPTGQTNNDVAVSFNKQITDILRNKMGFKGAYVADWNVLEATKILGFPIESTRSWGLDKKLTLADRAEIGIKAGVNQFGGQECTNVVVQLVCERRVPISLIDASARLLLRTKFELGLFDNPFVDENMAAKIIGNSNFMAAGMEAQKKSVVLLKNDTLNNHMPLLPLSKNKLKIYSENIDTLILKKYAKIVTNPGAADICILRLKTSYQPRKGFLDKMMHHGDLDFKEPQRSHIVSILKTTPSIVDIYLDRAAVIPEIASYSKGLFASFGISDEAFLEVVFGNFNPQGKLPIEMPSSMEAVHSQKEDVPFDSNNPMFPFGFGLSYK